MYSAFGWNAQSIAFIWSNPSLKACVSLLIFYLDDLSIDVRGVVKSPTITVTVNFSLYVCSYMLYVFSCSYVGCI